MEFRVLKNTDCRVCFPIMKSDGTLITGATGLDSEYALLGAHGGSAPSFTDCTHEATEIGSTGLYYLDVSAAEVNDDRAIIIVKSSSTGAITQVLLFNTTNQVADLQTIKGQTVTCAAGVTVLASVGTAATSTAQTGDSYALANGANGFAAIKGDTAAILTDTGTTLDGKIDTIDGIVDTLTTNLAKVPKSDGTVLFNSECVGNIKSGLATPENILGGACPAAWGAGTLGKLVGDNLNAPVGTVDTVVDGIATTLGAAGAGLTALASAANLADLHTDVGTLTTTVGAAGAGLTALASAANLATVDTVVDGLATTLGAAGAGLTGLPAVTLANGPHGGAAFTLTGKSIALTNSDGGGNALALVANGVGGVALLASGTTSDIAADITGEIDSVASVNTGGISADSIAANAIGESEIADGAINNATLAADVVVKANVTKINSVTVTGAGTVPDPWGA